MPLCNVAGRARLDIVTQPAVCRLVRRVDSQVIDSIGADMPLYRVARRTCLDTAAQRAVCRLARSRFVSPANRDRS